MHVVKMICEFICVDSLILRRENELLIHLWEYAYIVLNMCLVC